jgi:putative spermidine/putrescine transport system substrate-binding protein
VRNSSRIVACAAALGSLILAAGCGNSSGVSDDGWGRAADATANGGMPALIAAAKSEGQLNVIGLPPGWANFGAIMKAFEAKYGIKVVDANPGASSQDEIRAVRQQRAQPTAPDVLDLGTGFAVEGDTQELLDPYRVANWAAIPDGAKSSDASWYADYGGYMAIGYDPARVKVPPTSFKSLLRPAYRNQVAINSSPTRSIAGLDAVWAAALASGGSLSDIAPGVSYFRKLHQRGNFVPGFAGPATVANGSTPILVWWEYALAAEIKSAHRNFKIVIPSDGHFASYYDQAISRFAPHPAAARLWEEFLFSTQGQNLLLAGKARPAELATMIKDGTVNQAAYKALPAGPPGPGQLPTQQQASLAEDYVVNQWLNVVG